MKMFRFPVFVLPFLAALFSSTFSPVQAASSTWAAAPVDPNWGQAGNWMNGVPGAAGGGLSNSDVATFLTSSTTTVTLTNSAGAATVYNIGGMDFGANGVTPTSFTIGAINGSAFQLTSGGVIQFVSGSTGSVTETINAPLQIVGGSAYTFTNNATNTSSLKFAGTITGTTGATTLTLNGTSTGTNTIPGAIGNGTANSLALTASGSGGWTLTGANTYSGVTTAVTGTLTAGTNANLSGADGGWFIGDPSGNNSTTRTVTFNGGSSVSVASGKIFQIGFTGATGATANFNSFGTVNNRGALNVQRSAVVIIKNTSVWTQTGPLLIAAPNGSGISTLMTLDSGSSFIYDNASNPILFNPAASANGNTTLNISGTLTTNQGITDTVATSGGTAAINLIGGTLKLSADIPVLTSSAGSAFNFNLGAGGGTINTNGFSTAMNRPINGTAGLTKSGGGTLTFNAAAVQPFTGGLIINGGTLTLDFANLAPATDFLANTNPLTLGGGALNILGNASSATSQTLASLALTNGTSSNIVLNPNGGSGTTLAFTGTTASSGAAVNFNYAASNTTGSIVGNAIVNWNPPLSGGLIGTGYTVTDSGGTGYATVLSGQVVRISTGSGLPTTGGSSSSNYFVDSSFSTSSMSVAGSLVEALSGNVAANTVTVNTAGLTTGANLALGANTLTFAAGGGMTFGGANPYAITATAAGGLVTGTAGGSIVLNNYSTNAVTINAPILDNSNASLSVNGTGATTLSGANTYTGSTTIGGVLQIGGAGTLSGGTYSNSVVINGTLRYSSSAPQTFSGIISGAGSLIKDTATSNLTLSNANTFTGGLTIKAGTLTYSNATAITTSSSLILGDAAAANGTPMLTGAVAYTYNKPIAVVGTNQTNTINASATTTYNGAVMLTNASLTMSSSSGSMVFNGGFSGTGNLIIAQNGASSFVLAGGTVSNAGTITSSGTGSSTGVSISASIGSNVTGITLSSASEALAVTGLLTVNAGGTTLTNTIASRTLTISGGVSGTGDLILRNNNLGANAITVSGVTVNPSGVISNTSTGSGSVLISAPIGSAVTGIVQNSANVPMTLSGASSYTAPITLAAGTLRAGAGTTGGVAPTSGPFGINSAVAVASGALMDMGGFNQSIGSLADSGANGGDVFSGSAAPVTLTIGGINTNTSFSGQIQNAPGVVSVMKIGSGTQTFKATQSYSGTTIVSAGTIAGNATFSASAFSVAGGTLAPGIPGGAFGTMTVASADFSSGGGGTLKVRVANTGNDLLQLTSTSPGALTMGPGSTLVVDLSGYTFMANAAVTIAQGPTWSSAGFSSVQLSGLQAGVSATVRYLDNTQGGTVNLGQPNSKQVVVALNGNVAPVTIESFSARADGLGVLVEWNCVSEFQNAGFNVYRRQSGGNEWTRVNPALINGRITNPDAKRYLIYDWAPAGEYVYKLESVDIAGQIETHAQFAGPVAVGWDTMPVTLESIGAANENAAVAAGVRYAVSVGAKFAAIEKSAQNSEGRLTGRSIVLLADARSSASQPEVQQHGAEYCSVAPGASGVGVRWLSSKNGSAAASFTANKVVYSKPGVMLIPQALLGAGFDVNHLAIQREGRNLPALAVFPGGLLVYAPGYEDDYTDRDALFLRKIAGATQAGVVQAATGLFDSTLPVSATSPATASVEFHDVYFDFSYRPFTFTPWFSGKYLSSGTTQSFALNTPSANSAAATLTISLWSLTSSDAVNPDHALQVVVNGTAIGSTQNWDGGEQALQLTLDIPAGVLIDGANQIELVTPALAGMDSQISFLHSLRLDYVRTLDGSTALEIVNAGSAAKLFEIANLPSAAVWVVDTRLPDRAALVPAQTQRDANGAYRLRFMANGGGSGRYLLVPAGQENAPLSVSLRQVKPVRLGGTYLAAGPSQFAAGVQPLLMLRAREGIRVQFVDQEQLFDNYNFGRFGPAAIQKAVRAMRPEYLLLLGRTTYDYKNYGGANVDPLCPTFLVPTSFWAQSTSDSKFGDLGRGYPEVAIGRLPANNASELAAMAGRILSYKGAPVSGVRGHLVADATDPDAGDFGQQNAALAQAHPDIAWQANTLGVTYQTAPEVTEAMTSAANGEADFVIYNGHGNSVRLGKNVPRILDVDQVQNWKGNVVFLQCTCAANWAANNVTGWKSIAMQAMTQPQGGISASIGTSTYMNSGAAMAFLDQLLRNAGRNGTRWGKALMLSQQWALKQGGGASGTTGFYPDLGNTEQIFGDPAMPVFSKSAKATGGAAGTNGGAIKSIQPGTF